jgi:hypothetical protein
MQELIFIFDNNVDKNFEEEEFKEFNKEFNFNIPTKNISINNHEKNSNKYLEKERKEKIIHLLKFLKKSIKV